MNTKRRTTKKQWLGFACILMILWIIVLAFMERSAVVQGLFGISFYIAQFLPPVILFAIIYALAEISRRYRMRNQQDKSDTTK